ncbi:hypothetical protein DWQ67_02640 [Galactobacter caseinivorans]|uniref:Uncharacterized protein n=1 Tax=Galactobacter caseinivorans TaxID=2676123 RepID=A0A496PMH1_9MICC|nr:hypothetical protein DWQ67_02640 [Galactobacter caseinivorans]
MSAAAGGFAVGSGAGVYLAALTVPLTVGTLEPADPTNARADRVVLRIDDPTNGGGTGREASVEIITGTPSAVPALPSVPGTSVYADLARIDVPRSGAGSPAVTDLRKFTAVAGGMVPVATKAELDAWVPPLGTMATTLSDGQIYTRRAGKWVTLVPGDDLRFKDSGWVNLILSRGYVAGGGATPQARLFEGVVYVRGQILKATGTFPTGETVIAKLPAGIPGPRSWIDNYSVLWPNPSIETPVRGGFVPSGDLAIRVPATLTLVSTVQLFGLSGYTAS